MSGYLGVFTPTSRDMFNHASARAFAVSLGTKLSVRGTLDAEFVDMVVRRLDLLEISGCRIPKQTLIDGRKKRLPQYAGRYDAKADRLEIRYFGALQSKIDDTAANAETKGLITNGTRTGTIDHEMGHAQHVYAIGAKWVQELTDWSGLDGVRELAGSVSERAKTNPAEFVAEVFAGLAIGKSYPSEIMDAYLGLGGVVL